MAKDELLVIDRAYELVKWFLGHLAKFPRSHRYGLGQRIEARLYDVWEGLIRAKYGARGERAVILTAVNLDSFSRRPKVGGEGGGGFRRATTIPGGTACDGRRPSR